MTDLNPTEKNSKIETAAEIVGRAATTAALKMALEAAGANVHREIDTTKISKPDMDQATVKKLIEAAKNDKEEHHVLEVPNWWQPTHKPEVSPVKPEAAAPKDIDKTESHPAVPEPKNKVEAGAERAHKDYAPDSWIFKK